MPRPPRVGKPSAHTQPPRSLKTLERVFSKAGIGSRSDARSWIGARRVRVNGRIVENPDHWVDLDHDTVTLDHKPLREQRRAYLLLYKPAGYLTTWRDPQGRPTVYDLVADAGTWLSPVGRLDLDTSGLLILTNDTDFAERIANPDHRLPKTYLVKAAHLLGEEQLEALRRGPVLDDGPTRPAVVTRVRDSAKYTFLEVVITEGRNRQVRRMIEAIGSKVLKLVRLAIGPVRIGDLQIGKWRRLTDDEIRVLGGTTPSSNTSARRKMPKPWSPERKNPPGARS